MRMQAHVKGLLMKPFSDRKLPIVGVVLVAGLS
jgi:hypothetical protein